MKIFTYTIISTLFLLIIVSCNPSTDESFPIPSSEVTYSGCKGHVRSLWQESILLKTVNNKLQINHIDVIFSCEPGDITANAAIVFERNKIVITEKERQTVDLCYCTYDLLYTISIPTHGTYDIEINGIDFGRFDYNDETDIRLDKK